MEEKITPIKLKKDIFKIYLLRYNSIKTFFKFVIIISVIASENIENEWKNRNIVWKMQQKSTKEIRKFGVNNFKLWNNKIAKAVEEKQVHIAYTVLATDYIKN